MKLLKKKKMAGERQGCIYFQKEVEVAPFGRLVKTNTQRDSIAGG